MKQTTAQTRLAQILSYGVIAIIVLMPFHAVFTTWLASHTSHFDLLRILKDLLMVPLGLGSLWIAYQTKLYSRLGRIKPLITLILIYTAYEIFLGIWAISANHVNASALLYGWINDLQYLAFFVIALIVSDQVPLKNIWRQIVLIPAAIVVAFGLLQHFVLPSDFLRHIGYGPHSLPVYETIDQKTAYIRVQSSLRGPNPLGAYLVLVITSLIGLLTFAKKRRLAVGVFLLCSMTVLFYTYSRSAWIGALIGTGVILWLNLRGTLARRVLLLAAAVILLVGTVGVLALRNNDHIENIFFHTDEHSRSSESSNHARGNAIRSGLKDIWHEPLGGGPGTAGPASARNDHQARIAENYYLQIGQELGIIGLALFIAINCYAFVLLFRQRADTLSAILLASFVGIGFVNMLSHGWSDDTLSLIWWGMAAIALSSAILNTNKHKRHGKTKKASTA